MHLFECLLTVRLNNVKKIYSVDGFRCLVFCILISQLMLKNK